MSCPRKFFEGDPSSDHAMNRKRILNALQNLKSKDSAAGKYGIRSMQKVGINVNELQQRTQIKTMITP
ncbi:hypothetical protein LENED_005947 [Lentinula edodes]|uniref:Uncharacterized protein n=1 Tax=Lentinula edodes TaxID=5353 RepID=A0A1Q3EAD9_LENED|nr:hypothetical protein LENED_005947 [Lentinula edodes]